jgi:hypothetical protein
MGKSLSVLKTVICCPAGRRTHRPDGSTFEYTEDCCLLPRRDVGAYVVPIVPMGKSSERIEDVRVVATPVVGPIVPMG